MKTTKQAELLLCRNCGGQCDPTGWMCGDGRQGPECEGCGITTPDVESWNKLMAQSAPEPVQGEAVHWRALLRTDQRPAMLNDKHVVGFTSLQAAESWVAEKKDFQGWDYAIEPLYTAEAKPDADHLPAYRRKEGVMGCKRFMTQKCYDAQSPEMKARYEPFHCAHCLEAKPDAELVELLAECRVLAAYEEGDLYKRIDAKLAELKK